MGHLSTVLPANSKPTLYWISGSPPAWRVMLGLMIKGISYESVRLDHGKGENKTPEYLAINPRGQVPSLVQDGTIIRESIAILAYLDRAYEGPMLFGDRPDEAAAIWQLLMEFECYLRPAVTKISQTLLRKEAIQKKAELEEATTTLMDWISRLDEEIKSSGWLASAKPSAVDCWLYPAIGWIERAVQLSSEPFPPPQNAMFHKAPNLLVWRSKFEALPGFDETIPPHWKQPFVKTA